MQPSPTQTITVTVSHHQLEDTIADINKQGYTVTSSTVTKEKITLVAMRSNVAGRLL